MMMAKGIPSSKGALKPVQDEKLKEKEIFEQAREYLKPGAFSRSIAFLYAERKLLVFFLVHFVCTMIIWGHFFLVKWQEQKEAVPEAAPYYWLKRAVPSLEFGAMHAILFQMALIPLSMSRFSIAALSESILDRFVPLNRAVRIHIYLGYVMILVVFFATLLFFGFFGFLCGQGEQEFCDKFKSEIIITGYCIFAFLLIILGTSYFRHRMPYELFYAIHHLVFLIYIATILHTLDNVQRKGERNRSQSFVWFSATLMYYLCDRAAMYVNHRYQARLVASSTVAASNGSRMIILRLRRPVLFDFKPGQYAFLKMSSIDPHWHPFSIASGPDSSTIEFYIEVCGDHSWTGQLWSLFSNEQKGDSAETTCSKRQVWFEVMGPYGTSLGARPGSYSHALAIGAGTGIVPIISLFRQHVEKLLRLDPARHFEALEQAMHKAMQIEKAEGPRKGSFAGKTVSALRRRRPKEDKSRSGHYDHAIDSVLSRIANHRALESSELTSSRKVRRSKKTMQRAAFQASRSIKGIVLLSVLPVLGVALIGLTISWNTVKFDVTYAMLCVLKGLTVGFQVMYAVVALAFWSAHRFFFYTDVALLLVAPFADWYWFTRYDQDGVLSPGHITLFCLLTAYFTARLWNNTVRPRNSSWHSTHHAALERLKIVWVTRSASLVSEVLPEIKATFDELVAEWGMDARKVCPISIYVTDEDQRAICSLASEMHGLPIDLYFDRPDLAGILEDHTLDLITTRRMSRSLLTFCGSQKLATELNQLKIANDIVVGTTGRTKHVMDFVSESYGGTKPSKTKRVVEVENEVSDDDVDVDEDGDPMRMEHEILCTRNAIEFVPFDGTEASWETSLESGWEI